MAKPILATNFKDDIMQESMNGKRRYRMVNNTDGTVSFEDATDYEQVGNTFGAGQINATNEAVNQSVDSNKLVKELSTISAITKEGYVPDALAVKALNNSLGVDIKLINGTPHWSERGADTFTPFSSIYEVMKLGNERTIDITNIVGAKYIGEYTEDDFICEEGCGSIGGTSLGAGAVASFARYGQTSTITKSYNASTGVLTITGGTAAGLMYQASNGALLSSVSVTLPVTSYLIRKTPL